MRKTPMNRATPGALAFSRKKRKPLNAISEKQRARIEVRKATRAELLATGSGCAVAALGGPGRCFGPLTHHHVVSAAQGGSDGIENGRLLCQEHNRLVSQDADVMRWARANGLLRRNR